MPTINEEIFDAFVRHQIYLLRYAGGLRNSVLPILAATEKDLHSAVIEWIARAEGNRQLIGKKGRKWQKDFADIINGIRKPAWDEISEKLLNEFKELATVESAATAQIINKAIPTVIGVSLPPTAKLFAIVNTEPFQGHTLKQWLKRTKVADINKIIEFSKIGIVQGSTPTEVARGIIGSKKTGYRGSVARKAFRNMESLILTITNGVQAEVKQALYEVNSDLIEYERYVATLDVRTTIQCASNDGKIFKRDEGPIPPLHFRCRSLRAPSINPEALYTRGYDSRTEKKMLEEYIKYNEKENIGTFKNRDSLPYGHKVKFDKFSRDKASELVGQFKGKEAQISYSDWLKRQSKTFKEEVLGKQRAKWFEEGKLKLDQFVDKDENYKVIDIAELKSKYNL